MSCVSPGIAWRSLAQAPKSISLQRSLQNGRHGDESFHFTGRLQVGHREGILWGLGLRAWGVGQKKILGRIFRGSHSGPSPEPRALPHVHVVNKNGTSCSACVGRTVTSDHFKKRIVQR